MNSTTPVRLQQLELLADRARGDSHDRSSGLEAAMTPGFDEGAQCEQGKDGAHDLRFSLLAVQEESFYTA